MMPFTKHTALGVLIAAAFVAPHAGAHHSFAALFDTTTRISLTGEVVDFEFRAPHAYIRLDVAGETGDVTAWQVETSTPGMLIRLGITPASIRTGDRISVDGNPTRDGRPLIRLLTVTLADGTVIEVQ